MAKKKENLREMKRSDLDKRLAELRAAERKIKFQAEGARSKNVKEHSTLKKDIARILTELNRTKAA
jgi:ribosomal protein L29